MRREISCFAQKFILNLLYPARCPVCDRPAPFGTDICPECFRPDRYEDFFDPSCTALDIAAVVTGSHTLLSRHIWRQFRSLLCLSSRNRKISTN